MHTQHRSWIALAALALLAACPEPVATQASNTPPSIVITEPSSPDGDPPTSQADEGLVFAALVTDAEDPDDALVTTWTGLQTDELGAEAITLGTSAADSEGATQFLLGGVPAGNWTITATVADTDGATDFQSIDVVLLSTNTPPQVAITSPADGDTVLEGDAVEFVGTAFDDTGAEDLEIVWSSSQAGTLNALPPDASGLLGFTTSNLATGEHIISLTATDDGGLEASAEITITVAEQNLPPSTPTVDVTPNDPFAADDLVCLVLVAPTDPEGQPVTTTYSWLKDGLPVGLDSPNLAAGETTRGEEWTCEVVGDDGTQTGEVGSDSVTIANSIPTITSVDILPSEPTEASTLNCLAGGWADADGDAPDYLYAWVVEGNVVTGATTATLDGSDFDKGDQVECEVTPTDGIDAGSTWTSAAVTIGNSAPTDPSLTLTPSGTAEITDSLVCQASGSTDADPGDTVTYFVEWWLDGTHDPAWDGQWVIPWGDTAYGDSWECQAWADDGEDSSNVITAGVEVLPNADDLVITEFLAQPSAVSDVDGEWVELWNATSQSINLAGFELRDDGSDSHVIASDLFVGPGEYIVLARNAVAATNGNVDAHYDYEDFVLDDDADEIVLEFDGIEIDRVDYDIASFDWSVQRASASLDPDLGDPDPSLNDDPASWCGSSTLLDGLSGDMGTPGLPNDLCLCFDSDGDGDGFGVDASCPAIDCEDGDATIAPDASEVCNGVDDNCIDGVDEGCNEPPTLDDATLGPDPAYEDSVLECEGVNFQDPEGDPEGYQYAWFLGSTQIVGATDATLDGSFFSKDDTITCVLTPWDGQDAGAPQTSNAVVIQNTAPTNPTVTLAPSPTALISESLACGAVGSSDIDLDGVTYEVRWAVDGLPQAAYDGQWSVPASDTALGEEWTCEARANDGDGGLSDYVGESTVVLPGVGDVVISEVMVDPTVVGDASGEWIEVYNASGQAVDLLGFEITDDSGDFHQINTSLVLGSGQYAVLARNADSNLNGGIAADYDYSGVTLSNGQDQVVLEFLGLEVDRVEYDLGLYANDLAGTSLTLDSDLGAPDAVDNNAPGNWCGATTVLTSPGSDFATPGAVNDSCLCWDSDGDFDNYGDHATCVLQDCNDADANSNPEAADICENGQDEDCDGADATCDCLATDDDGDGFGDGLACVDIDCNDNDASINPNATESCDGVDEDCDGDVDEDFDVDGDGWTTCAGDCNDSAAATNPAATEVCDGGDNDCDGSVDEGFDGDADGYTSCGGDCNDGNNTIHPAATEACDNVDQNCDGILDNGTPSIMCPATTAVATTECISGNCQVDDCSPGFYDIDNLYGSGCECADDLAGASCGTALNAAAVSPGDTLDITGVLPTSGNQDWISVTFPRLSRPGGGTVHIEFLSNPSGTHTFDVYADCAQNQMACNDAADSEDLTEFSFWDAGSPGYTINNTAWPDVVFLRVQRTGGDACSNYTLRITR